MNSKKYYVYIMSNFTRTVLYIGVTSDLLKRVYQHKQELLEGFTKKYKVHDLLYYEFFDNPEMAIEREKQLKKYSRRKKEKLVSDFNVSLNDLSGKLAE